MADSSSFGPGVEVIGFESESVISARTAMNKSAGVTVASWMSEGYGAVGEFIEMRVSVRTAGTYDVSVDLES